MLRLMKITLLLSITSLQAMDQIIKDMKPLHEIRQLRDIDVNEVEEINKFKDYQSKEYKANLSKGDILCVKYFHSGPLQNLYCCWRSTENEKGVMVELPVDKKYYSILKHLYKKQQENKNF